MMLWDEMMYSACIASHSDPLSDVALILFERGSASCPGSTLMTNTIPFLSWPLAPCFIWWTTVLPSKWLSSLATTCAVEYACHLNFFEDVPKSIGSGQISLIKSPWWLARVVLHIVWSRSRMADIVTGVPERPTTECSIDWAHHVCFIFIEPGNSTAMAYAEWIP